MSSYRRWVELLAPDTYKLSDGRVLTFTPGDARNAVAVGNRMLRAGLRVPACWAHQDEAAPVYLGHEMPIRNVARDLFGELRAFRLGSHGRAEGLVEIPDGADAKQFLKVNGVSPRLQRNWVDEQGVTWPGLTVGHLAATPTPIARKLKRPADLGHASGTIVQQTSVYDLAHSTRGADMADEADDTGADAQTGDSGNISSIIESLGQLGITLPPEAVTDLGALDMALKVAVSVKNGTAGDTDLDGDGLGDQTGGDVAAAAAPPAFMSHMVKAGKTLTRTYKLDVQNLQASGRIDGKTAARLRSELDAASLSHTDFDKDGELKPRKVHQQIEAYKALPPGKFDKSARGASADLGHTTDVAEPGKAEAEAREQKVRAFLTDGLPEKKKPAA